MFLSDQLKVKPGCNLHRKYIFHTYVQYSICFAFALTACFIMLRLGIEERREVSAPFVSNPLLAYKAQHKLKK